MATPTDESFVAANQGELVIEEEIMERLPEEFRNQNAMD